MGATVVQDGRRVPVGYPVSADWSGPPELHIGAAEGARPNDIATFDPSTGRLAGLRPGTIDLAVTVNGVQPSAEVQVTEAVQAAA